MKSRTENRMLMIMNIFRTFFLRSPFIIILVCFSLMPIFPCNAMRSHKRPPLKIPNVHNTSETEHTYSCTKTTNKEMNINTSSPHKNNHLFLNCRGGVQRQRPKLHKRIKRRVRMILRQYQGTKNFIVWNGLAYTILHKIMTLLGPIDFIEYSNGIVFAFWWISSSLKIICPNTSLSRNLSEFMNHFFLTPMKWDALRTGTRPLAAIGGSFSHIDPGHITANFSMFGILAKDTESMLGSSNFCHLYLVCALTSSLISCLLTAYSYSPKKKEVGHGLGASGAISGMLACWCCESHMRMKQSRRRGRHGSGEKYLVIYGKPVNPLIALVSYTFADLGGLLNSKVFLKAAELITREDNITLWGLIQSLFLKQNDTIYRGKKYEVKENVGYGAHLGGYLGGIFCYAAFYWMKRVTWFDISFQRRTYRSWYAR